MNSRRRHALSIGCLLLVATGCAAWWKSDQEFFGRYVMLSGSGPGQPPLSGQGGDALTAQGATRPSLDRQRLTLHLANHGVEPVPMSYVVDEYIAKTFGGRTLMLEKDEFFTYPDALKPGEEREVTVLLPQDVPALEIAQIVLKLNNGKTVIALKPILPRPSVTTASGGTAWRPITQSRPSEMWAPPLEPAEHVPVVPEPTGSPAPVAEPPAGTVPVVMEFQQELGSSLKLTVRWDDTGAMTALTPGDHRMFYVVPGQHTLHLKSALSSLETQDTTGRVPVSVSAEQPLRIHLDGRARLAGVELRARVWRGTTLMLDQAFAPDAQTTWKRF